MSCEAQPTIGWLRTNQSDVVLYRDLESNLRYFIKRLVKYTGER